MSEYFSEPKSPGGRVKVKLDLYNYPTKADLKNAAGFDTSRFAKKVDLASFKSEVDKLDIDKLEKVLTGLIAQLLHSFIQQSLNSGSVQVQILLAECRTMIPAGNKAKRLSSANHITKKIHHYHYHHHVDKLVSLC